jgi:hypothetical protein
MAKHYESHILNELRQLRNYEALLQRSFGTLSTARREARVSFLASLAEWKARAQRLDSLLDAVIAD